MTSPKEVLEKLEAGDFTALVGLVESHWLDAKETPYILDTQKQKLELAKDVTAIANASGGIIVIGYDCEKEPTTSGERICEVKEFPLKLVDPDKWNQILADLVHPATHGVKVLVFVGQNDKGVAAIVIDGAAMTEKPYIVSKMIDEEGANIGSYFGYFQRKGDTTPTISSARIQQQLSAGMQWSSIDQRLQAIEANLAAWGKAGPPAKRPVITDAIRKERLTAARIAVGRHDEPLVYYMANAEGDCDFPMLFQSRSERIVRLIDRPPELRPHGFEIEAGDYSEIVQGKLRRNLLPGQRLIELWRDGVFIYVAPGDEAFLGWGIVGGDKPIHINNFALAESILVFCWLVKFIFEEADPKPSILRLAVGFDNLTRPAGPATLRDVPESRFPGGHLRQAPDKAVEVHYPAELESYDPARMAYLLIEEIYHWLGFDSQAIPYVDNNGPSPKLDAVKLIEKPLPTDLPETPGFF
jgi:hypothetical protein